MENVVIEKIQLSEEDAIAFTKATTRTPKRHPRLLKAAQKYKETLAPN